MLKMEYRVFEQLSKYGLLTDFLKSKVLENKIKDSENKNFLPDTRRTTQEHISLMALSLSH